MKKTSIALLISSLFALAACSPNTGDKSASTPAKTETTASSAPAVELNIPSIPAAQGDIFLKIGDTVYSKELADQMLKLFKAEPTAAEMSAEDLKKFLIAQEAQVQEALKLGLNNDIAYILKSNFSSKEFLVMALYEDFNKKNPVTDTDVIAEYDKYKKQHSDSQAQDQVEYNASHILVDTEEKAKELIQKIKSGGDFAALAKDSSIDPGTATEGGSLGWSVASIFVPEFGDALSKLKKGEVTVEPVKSNYGWHVIKLLDSRKVEAPSMATSFPEINDDIKKQIRNELSMRKFYDYRDALIDNVKVD